MFVRVIAAGQTSLSSDFNTVEVPTFTQHEIDNTRYSVGTVYRRSATCQGFNALHQNRRDGVYVYSCSALTTSHVTSTVNQSQSSLGTQATQVEQTQTDVGIGCVSIVNC